MRKGSGLRVQEKKRGRHQEGGVWSDFRSIMYLKQIDVQAENLDLTPSCGWPLHAQVQGQVLARIFHELSATSPKSTASAALKGILGVLKYKTICSAPKMPFALHPQHFAASRDEIHETSRLGFCFLLSTTFVTSVRLTIAEDLLHCCRHGG